MRDEMILHVSTLVISEESPEAQTMKMLVPGKASKRGGSFYILYTEDSSQTGECINIRLKVKNGVVELNRKSESGAYLLRLAEGEECSTVYRTVFGEFSITVKTKRVTFCHREEEQKFRLQMAYDMFMDSQWVGDYFVVIDNEHDMINVEKRYRDYDKD